MSSANALQTLDRATGEVTTTPVFDLTAYLGDVSSDAAFKTQQALAAAYDRAVVALIGPNDVQQEGGRTFKKKSAWRKLARHFRISTSVVGIDRAYEADDFIATITVRATAPWGQYTEAVGSCSTSEATGRRVITVADAIATAETRATNRATSNLIAMGEVSAEEMGDRASGSARTPSPRTPSHPRGEPVMPFGKTKGTLLSALPDDELIGALTWARGKGKFTEFQAEAEAELDKRADAIGADRGDAFEDEPPLPDEPPYGGR